MDNKRTSFLEKEKLAYVVSNDNKLIIEKNKDNLTKILLTKNNIDFIFNELNDINKQNKELNWFETIKVPLVALLIALAFGTPIFFVNNILIQIVLGIASVKFLIMAGMIAKQCIKIKKDLILSSELQTTFLENECDEELEKLKQLESISKDKEVEVSNSVAIPRSKKIGDLKHKLKLIENYCNKKKEYINFYNNNSLNILMKLYNYSSDDIIFIKMIIEEELKKEIKENKNMKVKKLEK